MLARTLAGPSRSVAREHLLDPRMLVVLGVDDLVDPLRDLRRQDAHDLLEHRRPTQHAHRVNAKRESRPLRAKLSNLHAALSPTGKPIIKGHIDVEYHANLGKLGVCRDIPVSASRWRAGARHVLPITQQQHPGEASI